MTTEQILREALETIAAQCSGTVGSTSRADCMAAVASAALLNAPAKQNPAWSPDRQSWAQMGSGKRAFDDPCGRVAALYPHIADSGPVDGSGQSDMTGTLQDALDRSNAMAKRDYGPIDHQERIAQLEQALAERQAEVGRLMLENAALWASGAKP
jgi:hypothetical protein